MPLALLLASLAATAQAQELRAPEPANPVGGRPVAASSAPAEAVPLRWSWYVSGDYQAHTFYRGLVPAVRLRNPSGRWEWALEGAWYENEGQAVTFEPPTSAKVTDSRLLNVNSVRAVVVRRVTIPRAPLSAGFNRILPNAVKPGLGLGLYEVREYHVARSASGPAPATPFPGPESGRNSLVVKPSADFALAWEVVSGLELEASLSYVFDSDPVGPARLEWGGLTRRIGLAVRFF
jgi:hypothetical protein